MFTQEASGVGTGPLPPVASRLWVWPSLLSISSGAFPLKHWELARKQEAAGDRRGHLSGSLWCGYDLRDC